MANDKDFIVKNAVEVGGSTKTTLGTVTNDNIDLSTGNYFAHSPAGATTYTISNAATNQSFQLEVTGGTEEVAQNFSTTLYTGNDGSQTITNGIDLANDGGLIWTKIRDQTGGDHSLIDSATSWASDLVSNKTDAAVNPTYLNFVANSDGYSINTAAFRYNENTREYVSWAFKKAAGFFDVVTYTGNETAGRTVSHNLGSVPGCIIIKCTDFAHNWTVYHRGTDSTAPEDYFTILNATNARIDTTTVWNDTAPTSTEFTLGDATGVNQNGLNYVAYLFAHDTASDGQIQCGSYTGNGSTQTIDLGWEAGWVMIKRSNSTGHWNIYDTQRGITDTASPVLRANSSDAEVTGSYDDIDPSSSGFIVDAINGGSVINASGGEYIYVAIRSAADLDLTWPTSIEWAGGGAPAAPATGETDLFTISTDDGGTTYHGFKTADNLS